MKHDEIEYLNRLITRTETESVIKNLSTNKSSEQDKFIGEVYQIFKEELTRILLKLFQKNRKEGNSSPFKMLNSALP